MAVKPMLNYFRDHIYIINMESKLNQPKFLSFSTDNQLSESQTEISDI